MRDLNIALATPSGIDNIGVPAGLLEAELCVVGALCQRQAIPAPAIAGVAPPAPDADAVVDELIALMNGGGFCEDVWARYEGLRQRMMLPPQTDVYLREFKEFERAEGARLRRRVAGGHQDRTDDQWDDSWSWHAWRSWSSWAGDSRSASSARWR